ncbi:MAG: tRNA lysidine(34) synthetase TilS [Bacteroidales bacterium]|jgi:tRNA(Ile)-lysidine synthase|nr:tRNA lysidine(34) synthetase TilS [Bacteroidales bacterium]
MLLRTKEFIEQQQLLSSGDTVVIGVSGGSDSVALLDILHRLDYTCVVCHCNFHLRGAESLRDENFVRELAASYRLPFIKADFDTVAYSKLHGSSIEMAARELRYNWFEEMRCIHNAQAIAVAHQQNDAVETMLMNLARGAGIRGLTGIRPQNGYVVRPLLPLFRHEIIAYLKERNLQFITDSSNDNLNHTRNFIRHEIIPLFEKINTGFCRTMQQTNAYLSGTEQFYLQAIQHWTEKAVEKLDDITVISITELRASPAPETLLFEILTPFGFNPPTIADIHAGLDAIPGKTFFSSNNCFRLIKDREKLIVIRINREPKNAFLIEQGAEAIFYPVNLAFTVVENSTSFQFQHDKNIAYVDFDKIQFPLKIKRWEQGDWFVPFGMKGRKKISDFFSDNKLNLIEKENAWLMCTASQDIVWVVGHRSDNRYRIDEKTRKILVVSYFPAS